MDIIIITILLITTLLSFAAFYIAFSDHLKIRKSKAHALSNKVHFYVARDKDETLWLYLGKPIRVDGDIFISNKLGCCVPLTCRIKRLGLNEDDYKNLKCEDEPVEVFINLED